MNLRTEVNIPAFDAEITHHDKIFLAGSCFVENIGQKLNRYLFNTCLNPFGIVYNPASLANQIKIILSGKIYTAKDLSYNGELFFSYDHHGEFNSTDEKDILFRINKNLQKARNYIKDSKFFFFTFGTAWIYKLKSNGNVVSNCHKQPSGIFERVRLTPEEIHKEFTDLIKELKKINPPAKFIFTVSPVRHLKDGAIENNLSKSILNVAVHNIVRDTGSYYFPSFEIVYDELRDYRFYVRDMIHLSDVAIDFIWDKFANTFFTQNTSEIITRIEKIRRDLEHRSLFPDTASHKKFLASVQKKLELLKKEYPFLDITKFINVSIDV